MKLLGWCRSNGGFMLLNFAIWYWNTFLNKCGYVVHHCNAHFLLCFLLMIYYLLFIFILDYRNYIRQQIQVIFLSSKWVILQLEAQAAQLTAPNAVAGTLRFWNPHPWCHPSPPFNPETWASSQNLPQWCQAWALGSPPGPQASSLQNRGMGVGSVNEPVDVLHRHTPQTWPVTAQHTQAPWLCTHRCSGWDPDGHF